MLPNGESNRRAVCDPAYGVYKPRAKVKTPARPFVPNWNNARSSTRALNASSKVCVPRSLPKAPARSNRSLTDSPDADRRSISIKDRFRAQEQLPQRDTTPLVVASASLQNSTPLLERCVICKRLSRVQATSDPPRASVVPKCRAPACPGCNRPSVFLVDTTSFLMPALRDLFSNRLVEYLQSQERHKARARLWEKPSKVSTACPRPALYWGIKEDAPLDIIQALAEESPNHVLLSHDKLESGGSTSDRGSSASSTHMRSVVDIVVGRGRFDVLKILLQCHKRNAPNDFDYCQPLAVSLQVAWENVLVGVHRSLSFLSRDLFKKPSLLFQRLDDAFHKPSGTFQQRWNVFEFLYKTAYYGTPFSEEKPLLHALVDLRSADAPTCPDPALRLACRLYPDQLTQGDDPHGNLPLHLFVQSMDVARRNSEDTIGTLSAGVPDGIEATGKCSSFGRQRSRLLRISRSTRKETRYEKLRILVEAGPDAAATRNGSGYLPLHIALRIKWTTYSVLEMLLAAHPRATSEVDPTSGLFPFQMASGNVELSFLLLRANPVFMEQIVRESAKEHDELKQEAQALRKQVSQALGAAILFFSGATYH